MGVLTSTGFHLRKPTVTATGFTEEGNKEVLEILSNNKIEQPTVSVVMKDYVIIQSQGFSINLNLANGTFCFNDTSGG